MQVMNYNNYLETLPLASSVWSIPLIGVFYLIFSIFIGPSFMKNREPFKFVKILIPIFNIFQIIVNAYIVFYTFNDIEFIKAALSNLTGKTGLSEEHTKKFILLAYLWCLIKISDFIDTIFFVLTKKFSHISFLHVYHHFTTMIIAYVVFKYYHVEQNMVYAGVNCIVHVVMYTYYLLTSVGFQPKWKKLVTLMQLLQFCVLIVLTFGLICFQKGVYFYFSCFGICQCGMFLYLFLNFYNKSYKKNV